MATPIQQPGKIIWLPQEFTDLKEGIEQYPLIRDKLRSRIDRLEQFIRLQVHRIHAVQDVVDQLQLDIKYLLFDLEATRGERDEYRRFWQDLQDQDEGPEDWQEQ